MSREKNTAESLSNCIPSICKSSLKCGWWEYVDLYWKQKLKIILFLLFYFITKLRGLVYWRKLYFFVSSVGEAFFLCFINQLSWQILLDFQWRCSRCFNPNSMFGWDKVSEFSMIFLKIEDVHWIFRENRPPLNQTPCTTIQVASKHELQHQISPNVTFSS